MRIVPALLFSLKRIHKGGGEIAFSEIFVLHNLQMQGDGSFYTLNYEFV
jgi:hypothetical protein